MINLKRSSGIIVYRKREKNIEVLLAHPGGPFNRENDIHSWSLIKGLRNGNEKIIDTAKREFNEETGLTVNDNLKYLCSHKVNRNKLVIMFYLEHDYNLENCHSNTFKREFEGKVREYHEMDDYKYFDIKDAKEKVFKNQVYFIERLENIINN